MASKIRTPTLKEVEKLRLILSTYQDGTGMLAQKNGSTLPGWRDFERAVALAFGGEAQESKFIFDILLPDSETSKIRFGVSCKMKDALATVESKGRAYLELSNSLKKFWTHIQSKGIVRASYKTKPLEVGKAIIELYELWHEEVSVEKGRSIDLNRSYFLTLSYNKSGWYQLHQFSLKLPNPENLRWYFANTKNKKSSGKSLRADDKNGLLFEWYGESGGQLKYYPLIRDAIWSSELFRLEPLNKTIEQGIVAKVAAYFPELWAKVNQT